MLKSIYRYNYIYVSRPLKHGSIRDLTLCSRVNICSVIHMYRTPLEMAVPGTSHYAQEYIYICIIIYMDHTPLEMTVSGTSHYAQEYIYMYNDIYVSHPLRDGSIRDLTLCSRVYIGIIIHMYHTPLEMAVSGTSHYAQEYIYMYNDIYVSHPLRDGSIRDLTLCSRVYIGIIIHMYHTPLEMAVSGTSHYAQEYIYIYVQLYIWITPP